MTAQLGAVTMGKDSCLLCGIATSHELKQTIYLVNDLIEI